MHGNNGMRDEVERLRSDGRLVVPRLGSNTARCCCTQSSDATHHPWWAVAPGALRAARGRTRSDAAIRLLLFVGSCRMNVSAPIISFSGTLFAGVLLGACGGNSAPA